MLRDQATKSFQNLPGAVPRSNNLKLNTSRAQVPVVMSNDSFDTTSKFRQQTISNSNQMTQDGASIQPFDMNASSFFDQGESLKLSQKMVNQMIGQSFPATKEQHQRHAQPLMRWQETNLKSSKFAPPVSMGHQSIFGRSLRPNPISLGNNRSAGLMNIKMLQNSLNDSSIKADFSINTVKTSDRQNQILMKENHMDEKVAGEDKAEKQEWDLEKAIGSQMAPYEEKITNDRMILYALGIGFQKDPLNREHFNFTYEKSENFQSFPTMGVVVAHRLDLENLDVPGMPKFNPMKLLHLEESCEFFQPIKPDTTIKIQETILDLQDKRKATALVIGTEAHDSETGDLVFKLTTNLFIKDIGGFGNRGKVKIAIPKAPKRDPDAEVEETTTKNQAFVYRLNGDYNPLHVDPDMSAIGGFDVPILHGLCTLGITAKAVYEKYHPEDPQLLKKINTRFTDFVFPGETLVVQMWKEDDTVVVETKTKERDNVVLKGICELKTKD